MRIRVPLFGGFALTVVVCIGLACPSGCVGPQAVHQTRPRYNQVIQTSNNEELLLNLVRLRYLENAGFLPVTALTAQFELDTGVIGRGGVDRGGASNYGQGTLSFADRPTITFAPQRSPELTKGLLTRIPLETLYLFTVNGGDLNRPLRLMISDINGLENAGAGGAPAPAHPPEFVEFRYVAELLDRLHGQRSLVLAEESRTIDAPDSVVIKSVSTDEMVKLRAAGYGVRLLDDESGYRLTQTKTVRMSPQPEASDSVEMQELVRLLRLKPGREGYEVEQTVEGQFRTDEEDGERTKLTVSTRSILEVMYLLSQNVCVPPEHVSEGLVKMTCNPDGTPFDWNQMVGDLFRVECSRQKPKCDLLSVKYRGYWFYIDDTDTSSKITLNLFNDLFRLQRIAAAEGQPVLTLPVGR